MPLQVQLESVKLVNMFVFVLLVLIVSFKIYSCISGPVTKQNPLPRE